MAGKLGKRLSRRAERAQSAWSSARLTGRRLVNAVPLRYNNNNRSKNNSKSSRTRRPSSLGTGESIRTSTITIAGTITGGEKIRLNRPPKGNP